MKEYIKLWLAQSAFMALMLMSFVLAITGAELIPWELYLMAFIGAFVSKLPELVCHFLYERYKYVMSPVTLEIVSISTQSYFIIDIFLALCGGFLVGLLLEDVMPALIFFLLIMVGDTLGILLVKGYLNFIKHYFNNIFFQTIKTTINMENETPQETILPELQTSKVSTNETNTLLKAGITALLILLMLIPMAFINNLVTERKGRQESVMTEVKEKWAANQTLTTPYLVLPYTTKKDSTHIKKYLICPSQNVQVHSNIVPEEKKRSIFSVLLYNSNVDIKGDFFVQVPDELKGENVEYQNATLCMGVTDLKGIGSGTSMSFADAPLSISANLPTNLISNTGVVGNVSLTPEMLGKTIPFAGHLQLKGSDGLSFAPMSLKSNVQITSLWDSPSYNGSQLPATDKLQDGKGFKAVWAGNELSLPFGAVINNEKIQTSTFTSGVNIIQPVDNYVKTMRSVKYAILVIGLTFALFFVIELLQKNALHPIQYLLVGLALSLFYTLLLSFTEFTFFIVAYSVAAVATIGLISWYTYTQLKDAKTTLALTSVLVLLYGFIYILVNLEDVALLVGSIGLFIILAAIMYATKNIQWKRKVVSVG